MAVSVQMPKQGNTVEECLLVEWKVREGDSVQTGDALCSIETDKACFEVAAAAAGVVLRLLAKAGDLVPVLADIAIIGAAGESVDAAPASDSPPAAHTPRKEAPLPSGEPAGECGSPTGSGAAAPTASSAPDPARPPDSFRAVSPRARILAEKMGVNPAGIHGSGPNARIVSRDILAAVDAGSAARVSPAAREIMRETGMVPGLPTGIGGLCRAADLTADSRASAATAAAGETQTIHYKGIRKLIGDRMRQSLLDHAQLTLNASANASGLLELRKLYKEKAGAAGLPNIGMNDMICWVIAGTLPAFPDVNAVFDAHGAIITRHSRVNLAFAVDTPRGLMTPAVADAHRLSLTDLSKIMAALAADCRKGSVNPDLLAGGTFTVSNLGALGVESFTPIINSPQVAIMGICAIRNQPEPGPDGGVVFVPRIGLSLTIDHQAVDGAPAARFLQAVAKGIEGIRETLALRGSDV